MPREVMFSARQVSYAQICLGLGVGVLALGAIALLRPGAVLRASSASRARAPRSREAAPAQDALPPGGGADVLVSAGRRLNRAAGVLAFAVLADSAVEHYRGSFHNRAMYAPLVVSGLALAVSSHGLADARPATHRVRHVVYLATALTGAIGALFHLYNVTKRPGGMIWQNAFYGAPLGAPAAIALSGALGTIAERVRQASTGAMPRVLGIPAARCAAAVAAFGLLGTVGEAGFLHFRGAYHDPFMFAPVTLPPVAALLLARTALLGPDHGRALTIWWLRITSLLGLAGSGFHAYGVHRNMGGWRNWRQNVLNGPPLPAPPSFSGLALAGLAAVRLIEEHPDG